MRQLQPVEIAIMSLCFAILRQRFSMLLERGGIESGWIDHAYTYPYTYSRGRGFFQQQPSTFR